MGKIYRMSDNEKRLLHCIGENPDMPMKELLEHTNYKWERTIKRKIKQLKELPILYGPNYDINYSKLCKNPLYKLYCVLELDLNQRYETVVSYLKLIEPVRWAFPMLSSYKKVLTTGFLSSDNAAMFNMFEMLKESNIITDYVVRVFCSKRLIENPNLFGDPNPPLDTLLNPCDIPDMSFDHHDTCWSKCDISALQHLEAQN